MKTEFVPFNLRFARLWMLLGFVSGLMLGRCFRGEHWLRTSPNFGGRAAKQVPLPGGKKTRMMLDSKRLFASETN